MATDKAAASASGEGTVDPAVTAALRWIEAHSTTLELCIRQQHLETELIGVRGPSSANPTVAGHRTQEVAYTEAKAAEESAAELEHRLLEEVAQTAATSLAGVIAKLAVVLREAEDDSDLSDFPVLHVRSVLHDLLRLVGQSASTDVSTLLGGLREGGPVAPNDTDQVDLSTLEAADEPVRRLP